VVIEFVLLALWARRRTAASRQAVLIGLAVAVVLITVQAVVRTDREQVAAACRDLADAFRKADLGRFSALISPSYAPPLGDPGGPAGKQELLDLVKRATAEASLEELRLRGFEFEPTAGAMRVQFEASCRVITGDRVYHGVLSSWELEWRESQDDWQVTQIRVLPRAWFPFRSLGDFPR
jgi:hypothetical protein